ncbi:carnosine synthase 1-like isoform X2 [Mercenaria mercenaria]|uniref:carnosine synthase 1-like isoform X2 n=1 Tax=Mercenaria mercenaria TaxID=6596 RepID=UPI00234F4C7B|nr:carnosine synthase 1-like isoform X2 [Mercenaria mercenaria]
MDRLYKTTRFKMPYQLLARRSPKFCCFQPLTAKTLYRCYHRTHNSLLKTTKPLNKNILLKDKNIELCRSFSNKRFLEGVWDNALSPDERMRQLQQDYDRVVEEIERIDKSFEQHDVLEAKDTDMAKGLVEICENYSKAHGSYVEWDTDVNLSPPKSWGKPAPEKDKYIWDYYTSLQYTLYETGHPETVDRTFKPRSLPNKEHVNVVLLSSPVECIGILLEGGKQLPDGFHLVLSPSWLSKVPSEEDTSLSSLLLHKSISFHSNGASFIDEYNPPRRVSYFVNYFTDNITSGHRNDGIEIESGLDCPMSSSIKLCELVDDKVWTRDIMADVGMSIPETLAIRRMPIRKLSSAKEEMKTIDFKSYDTLDMTTVEKEISAFAKRLQLSQIQKIVVKPSGPKYLGSVGVSFHSTSDIEPIVHAAKELLMEIDEGCSVLVEEFVESVVPLDAGSDQAPLWSASEGLGFRVRSTVCRDHDDTPVTTLINCAIADKHLPINGDNTVCQSLDSTLLAYNVFDESERRELEMKIRTQSADVLKMIMEREKLLSVEERGAFRGQTDVTGIDMVVTKKAGKLVPVGIEVNSHDCTINTQLYDFMMSLGENTLMKRKEKTSTSPMGNVNNTKDKGYVPSQFPDNRDSKGSEFTGGNGAEFTDKQGGIVASLSSTIQKSRYYSGKTMGRSVRPFVRNMISRSQRYMMKGKQVVVIGGGGYSKRNIWPDAQDYGIKIVLVDSDANHLARNQVHRFIHYDFDDHQEDFAHACNIFNLLHTQGIDVDGCLTFWEDCVPLAALVKEMTGTKGSSHKAALTGKKKSRTQNVLSTCTADIPHWPRTYLYSSKSVHIKSENDSVLVPKSIQFPAILKLEHGSSAVGVSVVKDEEEIRKKYHQISECLQTESDYPGIGLGHDNTMVAMEYHKGSEHDVDVILYDRKLVGAFISDNGPTRRPYFTETAAVMPSSLPEDKQAQLIVAAYQCCTEIGLSSGTFNVELLMTSTGPKLIEINARMGGFYLRDWIKEIYGVDLMLCSLMISCGVQPYVPKHPTELLFMGIMLIPSAHAHILHDTHFRTQLNVMIEKNEILFTQYSELDEIQSTEYEEPFGNIAVSAETPEEAKTKLSAICEQLGVSLKEYPVKTFLQYF